MNYEDLLKRFQVNNQDDFNLSKKDIEEVYGPTMVPDVTITPEMSFQDLVDYYKDKPKEITSLEPPSSPVTRIVNKMSPNRGKQISRLPVEYEPSSSEKLLAKAQDLSANARLINELGRAGELIGSGISGTKPVAQEIFKEQASATDDLPNQVLKTLALRRDDEKRRPESEMSRFYRDIAGKFGAKVPETATAEMLEKTLPWIEKFYNSKQIAELKKEIASQAKDEKEKQHKEMSIEKIQKDTTTRVAKLLEKEKDSTNNINLAMQLSEQATTNPAAATNLARLLIRAVEGTNSRVSDKDVLTAMRAGGISERAIAALQSAKSGTIPPFQNQDIQRMLQVMDTYHKDKFKTLIDTEAQRFSNQTNLPIENTRHRLALDLDEKPKQTETNKDQQALEAYGKMSSGDPKKKDMEKILRNKGLLK